MPSPISLMAMDMKYGQTATPIMYSKNNLKPLSRKLWQKENVMGSPYDDKWDMIAAPRFVNFSSLPETGDSFFNNVTVIVSTPKPAFENSILPDSIHEEEDTLVASFSNVNLSEIKREPKQEVQEPYPEVQEPHQEMHEVCNFGNSKIKEYGKNSVDNDGFQQKKDKKEDSDKGKKPLPTMVHPFTFELRDKQRQELKQQRINKILEEEKKARMFRAQPVPKFLKTRSLPTYKNSNDNNNDKQSGNNNEVDTATHNNIQRMDIQKKSAKHTEIWKKPPFIPCLPRESPKRPKTPPLHTTIRAQQRKHFNATIRERQRQREQAMQMEIAARKKQEEEEIALLRKQTVHKAQPIRKYKLILPEIEKRPLTDPMTPLSFKRRRRA